MSGGKMEMPFRKSNSDSGRLGKHSLSRRMLKSMMKKVIQEEDECYFDDSEKSESSSHSPKAETSRSFKESGSREFEAFLNGFKGKGKRQNCPHRKLALLSLFQPCSACENESKMEDVPYFRVPKFFQIGTEGTLQHRVFFRINGWQDISPWHDIPLQGPDESLHFVSTTPRGQWIRVEVAGNERGTPLRVGKSQGKPSHFYQNLQWNYGFLPQTASSSLLECSQFHKSASTSPVFAIDLSTGVKRKTGDVYLVKPLVAFLTTETETGVTFWNIVVIDREDKVADFVEDTKDLERYFPGTLGEVITWLKRKDNSRTCKFLWWMSPMLLFLFLIWFLLISMGAAKVEAMIANGDRKSNKRRMVELIEDSHKNWALLSEIKRESHRPISSSRPVLVSEIEQMWRNVTALDSRVQIPLSAPLLNSSSISEDKEILVDRVDKGSFRNFFRRKSWKTWKIVVNLGQKDSEEMPKKSTREHYFSHSLPSRVHSSPFY